MEELTTKLNKAVQAAADLPEIPRDENGKILIEEIATGRDNKNNLIIPDVLFDAYYKELPSGIINESRSWRTTATGGKIKILDGDPEGDKEIQKKGAEALNAANAQRRKLSETIDIFLKKKASIEDIEALGLEAGATKQDALIAAMFARAIEAKDVQAFNSLRDTAGEKPTDKLDASIMNITPADEELIKRVAARLPEKGNS